MINRLKRGLKNFFIPHTHNNHHPHFWKNGPIVAILVIILFVELGVLAKPFLVFDKNSFLGAVLPGVLVAMTNDQRDLNSATPLTINPLLTEAAKLKAADMAQKGYFSHNTPEGYLPWYWLDKAGYIYSHAGENLAVNFSDSKDVVDAWMKSPLHRANIVKQIYTETGIATAEGTYQGKPTVFVVQFFGTPAYDSKPVVIPPVVSTKVATSSTAVLLKNKPNSKANIIIPATTTASTSAVANIATNTTSKVAGAEIDQKALADVVAAKPGILESLIASPRHTGAVVLFVLLGLVIAALLLAVLINIKVQHPRIIILGVLLILLILGLIIFNNKSLRDPLRIGINSTSTTETI